MTAAPDMIAFLTVEPRKRINVTAENLGLDGEWPPPEELMMFVHDKTTMFYRQTYSQLPEGFHDNVARGAFYVDDVENWDGRT